MFRSSEVMQLNFKRENGYRDPASQPFPKQLVKNISLQLLFSPGLQSYWHTASLESTALPAPMLLEEGRPVLVRM